MLGGVVQLNWAYRMSLSRVENCENRAEAPSVPFSTKLSSAGVALGALAILAGAFLLVRDTDLSLPSVLLLGFGCALMAFLPSRASLVVLTPGRKTTAALLFLVAGILVTHICLVVGSGKTPDWERLVVEWAGSVLSLLAALFVLGRNPLPRILSKDTGIALCLFLLALGLRCVMLLTRSPVSIDDELHVFAANIPTEQPPAVSPFGSLNAFPALWYWAVYFAYKPLQHLADIYSLEKFLMASLGAISISAVFLFIRSFCERRVALCAAWLLCFLGWHWVNSRILYAYPIDLALISLVMLFVAGSLKSNHIGMAGLAGALSGLTVISQKIGIMVFPFVGYLLLDSFITSDAAKRKRVLSIALVWMGSAAFLLLPAILYWIKPNLGEGLLPRQSFMASGRAHSLASAGLTESGAFLLMAKDVFRQLLVSESDAVRHLFRIGEPILDPVFGLLFITGSFAALRMLFSQEWARLALVGLAIFALPMILSFPADGGLERGLARRMLGTCFFVAWFAGIGADLLSRRLLPQRLQGVFIAALCGISAFTNVTAFASSYVPSSVSAPASLDKDLGIQRSITIKTVRQLAKSGVRTLYLADQEPMPKSLNTKDIKPALGGLPNAEQVPSLELLRERLQQLAGKPAFVVVPGSTASLLKHYQDIPGQLADVVPSYLWLPGPRDQHGIPAVWYAFVYPQ